MSQQANAAVHLHEAGSSAFDLWAEVYDSQENPLLSLEAREVASLLPQLEGYDVLDVGCGTGRWLSILERCGPVSLTGIDSSSAMLRQARKRVNNTTLFYQDLSSKLSIESSSKDFILSSFVISYLSDLQMFALECARIIRPGGLLFISDMHPTTSTERNWKRNFSVGDDEIEIPVQPRALEEIISVFQGHGFDVQAVVEPAFDLPEKVLFELADKLADYENLAGVPAIYILKLKKRISSYPRCSHFQKTDTLQLTHAPIARGPDTWTEGALKIEGRHIASIGEDNSSSGSTLDLSGSVILPGLINAHDHLEFGLFPNLGRNARDCPYQNSAEWAREIHRIHATVIEQHKRIPKALHVWWGAIRNLLCGVTTVCHHNPLHPDFELSEFPIKIVSQFGWAHSLAFEPEVQNRFRNTPHELPFIIHASEGIDAASFEEILELDRMHLLDERTVVVHGLALTPKTIALINQRGASLVACPTSNLFLFSQTLSHDQFLSFQRIALGSDSPITAMGDLLDEIRYVRKEIGLDEHKIYKMVTSNAADMLHLEYGAGQIIESGVADIIAVNGRNKSPAATLSELAFNDIELVIRSGKVELASPAIYNRLSQDCRKDMQLLEVAGTSRWLRVKVQALVAEAENILGHGSLLVSGRQVRYLGPI
jgi:cytosine/adenosine deaminase-related metal-dependent hydrolase/ubiquinone/menaquinone biosynthesis C-methylase UbiE